MSDSMSNTTINNHEEPRQSEEIIDENRLASPYPIVLNDNVPERADMNDPDPISQIALNSTRPLNKTQMAPNTVLTSSTQPDPLSFLLETDSIKILEYLTLEFIDREVPYVSEHAAYRFNH